MVGQTLIAMKTSSNVRNQIFVMKRFVPLHNWALAAGILIAGPWVTHLKAQILAIPEPPVVFYGTITQSQTLDSVTPTTVEWALDGAGSTVAVAETQIITVNATTFYISRIPFETRRLADNTPLDATANTLEQTQTDTLYNRSAKVDGRNALLPTGKETFSYGTASMGQIERLDLVIGETFAEWAERVLGDANADPSGDNDNDGFTNEQEYRNGTDPNSGGSQPQFTLAPASGGGFTITFPTAVGQRYTIERGTNLDEPDWAPVAQEISGTGSPMTFTDPSAAPRLFYRIVAGD